MPAALTAIDVGAFLGCNSLRSVELPEGLLAIGRGAFAYCNLLSSVSIPVSVTQISEEVFSGCDMLTLTVEQGSYAHEYAETYDIPYTYLEVPDWLME